MRAYRIICYPRGGWRRSRSITGYEVFGGTRRNSTVVDGNLICSVCSLKVPVNNRDLITARIYGWQGGTVYKPGPGLRSYSHYVYTSAIPL